ncbi:MAG TPA: hypothetical protein DEG90_08625 [Porphyromonadaceae bacterium]|nr:hypothetical protein [Porphyromonadaceae bacterium]
MTKNFNTYIESPAVDYLRNLCLREGVLRHYDRYVDLHCKTAQQRYNDLISKHPDLFSLFPLKDIASFLNITQTHLSRLRKNT